MPLTPEELLRRRAEAHAPAIREAIERIDAAMADGFDGNRFIFGARSLPEPVVEAVARAYRDKGWVVRHVLDQPGGDFLEFTPGKGPQPRKAAAGPGDDEERAT